MIAFLAAFLLAPRFPADNVWNHSVAGAQKHARSDEWIARWFKPVAFTISPNPKCGIPITPINSHHMVGVRMAWQPTMLLPWGPDIAMDQCSSAPGWAAYDTTTRLLYECYGMSSCADSAGSGAMWNMLSDDLAPAAGLQASESGMPFATGLLFYQEAHDGRINHAFKMDFEWEAIADSCVWPARGFATLKAGGTIPLGERVRLNASFQIPDSLSVECHNILKALKTYGAFIADRAGAVPDTGHGQMNLWACPDPRWGKVLAELGGVKLGKSIEFVDEQPFMVSPTRGEWKVRW